MDKKWKNFLSNINESHNTFFNVLTVRLENEWQKRIKQFGSNLPNKTDQQMISRQNFLLISLGE